MPTEMQGGEEKGRGSVSGVEVFESKAKVNINNL